MTHAIVSIQNPKKAAARTDAGSRKSAKAAKTVTADTLLVNGSDFEFRRLVHRMLAFGSRLDAVRNSFAGYIGLSGIQYTILISVAHLQAQEQNIGVKRLAEHLGFSGAFVTIETNKLVKLDLLDKKPNPDDRRRVLLEITGKGHALLNDLAPIQAEVNDVLFGDLSDAEFKELNRVMGILRHSAGQAIPLADYLTGNATGQGESHDKGTRG